MHNLMKYNTTHKTIEEAHKSIGVLQAVVLRRGKIKDYYLFVRLIRLIFCAKR